MPASGITSAQSDLIVAGDLNRRVQLLSPVYNEYNDEITDWTTAATVWAAVLPNFAQEQQQSERTIEVIQAFVIIRFRADIDARWRVVDQSHTFEITGLVDCLHSKVKLLLSCKEVL